MSVRQCPSDITPGNDQYLFFPIPFFQTTELMLLFTGMPRVPKQEGVLQEGGAGDGSGGGCDALSWDDAARRYAEQQHHVTHGSYHSGWYRGLVFYRGRGVGKSKRIQVFAWVDMMLTILIRATLRSKKMWLVQSEQLHKIIRYNMLRCSIYPSMLNQWRTSSEFWHQRSLPPPLRACADCSVWITRIRKSWTRLNPWTRRDLSLTSNGSSGVQINGSVYF